MEKKVTVVMLPTDKVSDIIVPSKGVGKGVPHYREFYGSAMLDMGDEYHHLYIVTDDKIKEGDWCLFFWDGMKDGELGQVGSEPQQYLPSEGHTLNRNLRKIIATTNVLKIIDRNSSEFGSPQEEHYVPQIPQSFIESYCKNPVDKVMVEYSRTMDGTPTYNRLTLTSNNEIIIHPIEEKMYTREEVEAIIEKALLDPYIYDKEYQNEINIWIKENIK